MREGRRQPKLSRPLGTRQGFWPDARTRTRGLMLLGWRAAPRAAEAERLPNPPSSCDDRKRPQTSEAMPPVPWG